jgi:hypothetical protein
MRIFHQRLRAAKVLISDNEADEIVSAAARNIRKMHSENLNFGGRSSSAIVTKLLHWLG